MFTQKIISAVSGKQSAPMKRLQLAWVGFLLSLGAAQCAQAIPDQEPLFLSVAATPVMLLTMDKDHQLYYKAYNDYSDFTDPNGVPGEDGKPDTTYIHKYTYYGYFESNTCYKYDSSKKYFAPEKLADADNYCTGFWSGNFLNWATMTRIDVVRKILYGGFRSTDSATETVLERAYLPNDAHSFAKHYHGADLAKLTPFTGLTSGSGQADGITLCNTTLTTNKNLSQEVFDPPLILVAKGNYSLWASNERAECRWSDGGSNKKTNGYNGNTDTSVSGMTAYPTGPTKSGPGLGEFAARVKVCTDNAALIPADEAAAAKSNCKKYPLASFANKPIGLLQKYGETGELKFGLMTGSYTKNKSGGLLRKNVGTMEDEIDTAGFGTFTTPPTGSGATDGRIVKTLNKLRLYGYRYSETEYKGEPGTDGCEFQMTSFNDGTCSNWGNPQSEIYYEALRYLSGAAATSDFSGEDTSKIQGLTKVTWAKPVTDANYCAPLSILQFSGASSSYDVGAVEGKYKLPENIGLATTAAIDAATDTVGNLEGITGSRRFVGKLPSTDTNDKKNYQLCTAKVVDKLSGVSGICPEAPRFEGGYTMVGLARHARTTGIPLKDVTKGAKKAKVRTFGVAMASAIPKVDVVVPGTESNPRKVIIQPACRNSSTNPNTNCAIVDFKVISHDLNKPHPDGASVTSDLGTLGKLYVNWEDSEQGADYDQDMWGIMTYFVTATNVYITTQVIEKSTTQSMGFGYILSGTKDKDGFHVHSGVNYFVDGVECINGSGTGVKTCTCITDPNHNPLVATCTAALASLRSYQLASAAQPVASFLQSPLYYAAKWGGYSDAFVASNVANLDTAIAARDASDSYFFATSPQTLADNLETAFSTISKQRASASGVATNDNYLSDGTYIFRAEFNSADWSGAIRAFAVDGNGDLVKVDGKTVAKYSTDQANKVKGPNDRKIYVAKNATTEIVDFTWLNLSPTQKAALKLSTEGTDANAQKRVDWLRGSSLNEVASGFRKRPSVNGVRNVLGDFINSAPTYVGANDYHYDNLPETAGGTTYRDYVVKKAAKMAKIYVGGNDGMLHAFDVSSAATMLKEVYSYIPDSVFAKLPNLTNSNYGISPNIHQYLVDGPIVTGDVYINNKWRTIVVGTLGAGGRGVYALEVMNEGANGTDGVYDDKPKLLFELTEKTHPELGYVLGKPVIAPMADGSWAVIFGNGDTSGNASGKTSRLFVVNIANAVGVNAKTKVIDTKLGTGLSAPSLLPNAIGQATVAYAGDLVGNMYRFDLSGVTSSSWIMDYVLFNAVDQRGIAQPIFAAPTLGINSKRDNRTMVYFGTGKFYDTADKDISDTVPPKKPQNSYYAILDIGKGANPPVARSRLVQKTYGNPNRTINKTPVNWGDSDGWYLNLGDLGERVISTALLIEDKLIFPTVIPSGDICQSGGGSWIMEVAATGNKFVDAKVLEKNVFIDGGEGGGPVLGPLSIGKSGDDAKVLAPTLSDIVIIDADLAAGIPGRQSWRQVR